jgi:hypothetical protein
MAFNFETEIDREHAIVGIGNLHRTLLRKLVSVTKDSGQFAASNMKIRMPHATFRSAEQVHTEESIRTGTFGHLEYQNAAIAGDSPGSAVKYFAFGTGLWGPLHAKIRAIDHGHKAFRFKRTDGGNFTAVVKGQQPQREWIHDTVRSTGNYVRTKIASELAQLEFRAR